MSSQTEERQDLVMDTSNVNYSAGTAEIIKFGDGNYRMVWNGELYLVTDFENVKGERMVVNTNDNSVRFVGFLTPLEEMDTQ